MSHTVAAVGRRAAFEEIVHLMQDWKVSAVPVLEGEGRVVGVVRLSGHAWGTSSVPVAARLVRAVEGVVDVEFELTRSEGSTARTVTPANGDASLPPA